MRVGLPCYVLGPGTRTRADLPTKHPFLLHTPIPTRTRTLCRHIASGPTSRAALVRGATPAEVRCGTGPGAKCQATSGRTADCAQLVWPAIGCWQRCPQAVQAPPSTRRRRGVDVGAAAAQLVCAVMTDGPFQVPQAPSGLRKPRQVGAQAGPADTAAAAPPALGPDMKRGWVFA